MTEKEITKIGVIGAGSWGTTLANMLAEKGYKVDLWVREEEVYQQIKKEHINGLFLPGMKLVKQLNPVLSFEEALSEKDLGLLVVPSHVFRDVLNRMKPFLKPETVLMAATKGIENDTQYMMSQVAESVLSKEAAVWQAPALPRRST
jgi:glycerol-3-phosphate dehydrogenase (NAD(P)+)